jgi:hypothetical protein
VKPRIGYACPITDDLAFWPRVSASFDVTRQQAETGRVIARVFAAEANLALAIRLHRHVLFDVGPVVMAHTLWTEGGSLSSFSLGSPRSNDSTEDTSWGMGMRGAITLVF